MATDYPIVANCNYESADDSDALLIHEVRKAIDAGKTDDQALLEAMESLEATLEKYADRGDQVAIEACLRAERAIREAWTDEIAGAVESETRRRYASY
jgi:hypothetical protein